MLQIYVKEKNNACQFSLNIFRANRFKQVFYNPDCIEFEIEIRKRMRIFEVVRYGTAKIDQ